MYHRNAVSFYVVAKHRPSGSVNRMIHDVVRLQGTQHEYGECVQEFCPVVAAIEA